jgi:carbamoyl-phosphate synthase large subunit
MPTKGLVDQLQEVGATVIGVDAEPYSYGLVYADDGYVVPRGDDPAFVDELLSVVRSESVDALLLSPESEVLAVSKQREHFESAGCLPLCPSHDVVQRCTDKRRAHECAAELGVPSPPTYESVETAEFPCIVKPQYGRGSTGVHVAQNREELAVYASNVEDPIFQEFIPGTEYTVDVLADRDGTVLSVVPRERVGVESGKSVTGKTVADEQLREYSRRIASSWELFGPSCLQFIRGDRGLQFIEANTRFGGGAVLSLHADRNLIPNLVALIEGSETRVSETYETGLVMLRNYEQLFVEESKLDE